MKKHIVTVQLLAGLIVVLYIFSAGQVSAGPGTVEFTADIKLNLTGLQEDIFIAGGSEAASLEVSGNSLVVSGIVADGDPFSWLFKTADHNVLQLTPTGGSANLEFSSEHEESGYINQWEITTDVNIDFVVGVPEANTLYEVKLGEIAIDSFDSGENKEINFEHNGSGVYTVEELVIVLDVETISAADVTSESATLRGRLIDMREGAIIDVWFKWGDDKDLIEFDIIGEQEMLAPGVFRESVAGLVEGKTYYFQAVAEDKEEDLLIEAEEIFSFVPRDSIFITVKMGGKLRIIEIDQEGKIITRTE